MASPIDPPAGFEELPVPEKIAYVQALWDLIADKPEDVPVSDWHRKVLDQRLAEARSEAAECRPWSDVRADLQAQLKDQ